jgi:hypothetical protein
VATPEYNAWINMKQRCLNPEPPEYERYGGRGIVVCDRWLTSFNFFLEDMGERPSEDLSLERKDNNKGYSKENCKWEIKSIQSFNQRVSRDNKSGITGVYKEKQTSSWKAYIRVKGSQITLGRFRDFFEACCARKSAEMKYYEEVVLNV